MKKIVFIITIVIFVASPAVASTIFLRGSSTPATRTYLINLDFESSVAWDATAGTSNCALDDNGQYCTQSADQAKAGSYSAGLRGDSTQAYLAKSFTAKGELYFDFYLYVTPGKGSTYFALYNASNSAYIVSVYYYSSSNEIRIYNNGGSVLSTGQDMTVNTWWHFRVYWKRDTDDTDGVVKVWYSTTDDDFDGDTANHSWTSVDTYDGDAGFARLRGNSAVSGYKIYYDNVKIWEPDGNE